MDEGERDALVVLPSSSWRYPLPSLEGVGRKEGAQRGAARTESRRRTEALRKLPLTTVLLDHNPLLACLPRQA
jgi:hypothetical protein